MQKCILLCLAVFMVAGCSGRKVDQEAEAEQQPPEAQKIENLTTALSRAQTRIEELDAKLAVMQDKLESNRVIIDNLAGNKPIKTEAVGSAKPIAITEPEPVEETGHLQIDPATADFNKAMKLFKSGKYADAELEFNRFTERFPEHVLAGSAQFYAGESYLMMGEYKLALNEYNKVISSFGTSPRVPSAMVRVGHCQELTGNKAEASKTLALATELFPGNPSLDWVSPNQVATRPKVEPKAHAQLDASPIEPPASLEKEDAKLDHDMEDEDSAKH